MPHVPPDAGRRLCAAFALAGRRALRAAARYLALRILSNKPVARTEADRRTRD